MVAILSSSRHTKFAPTSILTISLSPKLALARYQQRAARTAFMRSLSDCAGLLSTMVLSLCLAVLAGCSGIVSKKPASASAPTPDPTTLTISTVSPDTGSTDGGATVAILGANFLSGATVKFGTLAATSAQVASSTEVRAVTPAAAEGVVDVILVNPNGQQVTAPNAFAFVSTTSTPPAAPALPQAMVDLTLPIQNGTVRNIAAGDSVGLQNAINAASCGDTIVLPAGSTFIGNWTFPNKSCNTGWILIQSSGISSLPAGIRVTPLSVSNMATLTAGRPSPVFSFAASSHHYRLLGLEVSCTTVCDVPNDLQDALIGSSVGATTVSQEPSFIIVDRCYVHGTPTTNIRRGMNFEGISLAVVDSYFSELHEVGYDSQAIAGWNGSGPFLIQNNFLSAASENVIFGGSEATISNLIPSDITIVGNHFWKNPAWRNAPGTSWNVKNLLEFKNAQRVLVDGNVLEYSWAAAQAGAGVLFTPRAEGGRNPWNTNADITFTHNLLQHTAKGMDISHNDELAPAGKQGLPPQRIKIQNNVLFDVSATNWSSNTGGAGWDILIITDSAVLNAHDIIIDHNTMFNTNAALFMDTAPVKNFQYTNNITQNDFWVTGRGPAPNLRLVFTNFTWNQNVLVGGTSGRYLAGTYFPPAITNVGFTDFSGGNYQLLSTSPYRASGTDGKDIGLSDWATYNMATSNAISGIFPR